jgi:hypothetical protein
LYYCITPPYEERRGRAEFVVCYCCAREMHFLGDGAVYWHLRVIRDTCVDGAWEKRVVIRQLADSTSKDSYIDFDEGIMIRTAFYNLAYKPPVLGFTIVVPILPHTLTPKLDCAFACSHGTDLLLFACEQIQLAYRIVYQTRLKQFGVSIKCNTFEI